MTNVFLGASNGNSSIQVVEAICFMKMGQVFKLIKTTKPVPKMEKQQGMQLQMDNVMPFLPFLPFLWWQVGS